MKPYILTCLVITIAFTASAQDPKANIKHTADLYVAALLKQDYPTLLQYMYSGRIAYYGGRDSLIKRIQNENKQNASQNSKIKNVLIGEPGRVVKYGNTSYSVVPDTVIFQFYGNADIGSSSSFVALSTDDGKSWTLASIENMKWLTSVLPDVAKLNIPAPAQLGILDRNDKPQEAGKGQNLVYVGRGALAMVVVTHKQEYLADTISIKTIKEKWIKTQSMGFLVARASDTLKYGKDAVNGINRYYIDDKKYPKAFSIITQTLKYVGPADTE